MPSMKLNNVKIMWNETPNL